MGNRSPLTSGSESGDLTTSEPDPYSADLEWDTTWTNIPITGGRAHERSMSTHHGDWERVEAPMPHVQENGKVKRHMARQADSAKLFTNPATSLPAPTLDFDFRIAVRMRSEVSHINVPGTGPKEMITISSGYWSGSFGSGTVVAGGHDFTQSRLADRAVCKVDTAFRLETSDTPPAALEMRTRGRVSGPNETLSGLFDPEITLHLDPQQYKFRMFITLVTTDERYAERLNFNMWIGCGMWRGEELVLDAFRLT